MVDLFEHRSLAEAAIAALENPGDYRSMRSRATLDVEAKYRRDVGNLAFEELMRPEATGLRGVERGRMAYV